jgi:hypothetical protein
MQAEVYVVEGGWHAHDAETGITTFGLTREDAIAALEAARLRREQLRVLAAARRTA